MERCFALEPGASWLESRNKDNNPRGLGRADFFVLEGFQPTTEGSFSLLAVEKVSAFQGQPAVDLPDIDAAVDGVHIDQGNGAGIGT